MQDTHRGKISCVRIDLLAAHVAVCCTHTSQLIVAGLWPGTPALLPEKFGVKPWGFFCFSNGAFYFCCLVNSLSPCVRGWWVMGMTGLWMWQLWLCPPWSHHPDKNNAGHLSPFCWQNFQQMLRYCWRWTCIIGEEAGKRFCSSKTNFPWLQRVYLPCIFCEDILIIWESPGTRPCSVALCPFIQMLFRVAALPFLR